MFLTNSKLIKTLFQNAFSYFNSLCNFRRESHWKWIRIHGKLHHKVSSLYRTNKERLYEVTGIPNQLIGCGTLSAILRLFPPVINISWKTLLVYLRMLERWHSRNWQNAPEGYWQITYASFHLLCLALLRIRRQKGKTHIKLGLFMSLHCFSYEIFKFAAYTTVPKPYFDYNQFWKPD